MTDAFADVVAPVIQGVIDFQDGLLRGKHPTLEEQKRTLIDLLKWAEDRVGQDRRLNWPVILSWRNAPWCTGSTRS